MEMQDVIGQVKTIYNNLNPARKITLFLLLTGAIVAFSLIIILSRRIDYQVLFSGLSSQDSGGIIAQLKAKKIPYEISSNGSAILVAKEKVYEIRMELASQGFPQGGGVGFEIFDNSKLGMTEFVQNVNYQRAIQGELTRTINQIEEIESCRVHIAIPPKSLFIEDEEPARASVVLKFRPQRSLTPDQIQGITHLLSSSVARLKPQNITIVDSFGNQIGHKNEKNDLEKARADQLAYHEKIERSLENRVKTMLDNALGPNKAIVRLSISLDFTKQEKTEERYYPDNKVVRSEQMSNESSVKPEKTPVGVPGANAAMTEKLLQPNDVSSSASAGFQKHNQTTNYEIGRITSHTIEPVGSITRLSAAVLVDGSYKSANSEDGKSTIEYVPRTPEELSKIKNIVMRAVNYSDSRGDEVEVVNIPFENPGLKEIRSVDSKEGWVSKATQYSVYIKYLFSIIFMVLTFIFVVRPLIQWITNAPLNNNQLLEQLPMTVDEIERGYAAPSKSLPVNNKLSELALADNRVFIEALRQWMKQT